MKFRHFRQQWPVGHGFFHSASVNAAGEIYRYIYDCGTHGAVAVIEEQIDRYVDNERLESPNPDDLVVDMVVISHFHSDHFNGLPYLLSKIRVKKLALPHLSDDFKLVALASLAAMGLDAWRQLSRLVIDPRGWLNEHHQDIELVEIVDSPAPDEEEGVGVVDDGLVIGSGKMSHHKIASIYSIGVAIWQFKFYINEDWESYLLIVDALCYELDPLNEDELKIWLKDHDWVEKNHDKVKTAFRSIGAQKQNAITLCMYSGAKDILFPLMRYGSILETQHRFFRRNWYVGWLGTGDANLRNEIHMQSFLSHYNNLLGSVDTITIPHHGSIGEYNAELGNIGYRNIITSDFLEDPKDYHPSARVLLNLRTKGNLVYIVTKDNNTMVLDSFQSD